MFRNEPARKMTPVKIFSEAAMPGASWQGLPYANLPRLIERASFVWRNILWHGVSTAPLWRYFFSLRHALIFV